MQRTGQNRNINWYTFAKITFRDFESSIDWALGSQQWAESLEEVGEVPGSTHVPHHVVEQADDVHHLCLNKTLFAGHYSLTLSTFPPYVFDTFTPCGWTFYPLCLTLLPPTIWHITPLFSFFSGIIFCQSFMSSGGVRNSKLSNTRGLPSAWGWWPSSWRMADSEVVCCQKRWWF